MKLEIRHPRFTIHYGRPVAYGQLYDVDKDGEGKLIFDGTLSQILELASSKKLAIENSQVILDFIVRQHGFAS